MTTLNDNIETMTGTQVAREMHKVRMQNLRMKAAIAILALALFLSLVLPQADKIDKIYEPPTTNIQNS